MYNPALFTPLCVIFDSIESVCVCCCDGGGSSGQLRLNCVPRELGNLESNECSGEARPPTTVRIYSTGEQGGIEYELCPRCWQTRGNRANLLSTLLNYWR